MSIIKKLDEKTISLISAGEVIEDPSDILKELIENAIDAKATSIDIKILSSGEELIEVKDNGNGISKEDLEIATEKYTTSKINSIDDLYKINSFGFRGEALSSINAVSKLSIISSNNNNAEGYKLENGKISKIPSSRGTTISVKDLFYNIPVRKKFLKSKVKEFSKLYNTFIIFAIQNPAIRFSFTSEKKNILFTSTQKTEERYLQIFDKSIISKTIPIDISTNLFSLSGIVSKKNNQFSYPDSFLYINNRSVFSKDISKLISSLYKDYLMTFQKPFFILFLELNPNTLDINVHPKKRIVKLEAEFLVFSQIKKELEFVLNNAVEEIRSNSFSNSFLQNQSKLNYSPQNYMQDNSSNKSYLKDNKVDYNISKPFQNNFSKNIFLEDSSLLQAKESQNLFFDNNKIVRILGQIDNTYILCEIEDGFLIIDQHAAAERINLEKNRENKYFEKQKLLEKISLDFLDSYKLELVSNNLNLLSSLGFEVEIISSNNYYLHSIPVFLENYFDKEYLLTILNDLENNISDFEKIKDSLIKLKSCKSSIKANEFLSTSQIIDLIKDLDKCKDKYICAHGRPSVIHISVKELEKMFKRVV
ncbi:MAG: DNA mismatch repair endonuclease MutL [archaeon]